MKYQTIRKRIHYVFDDRKEFEEHFLHKYGIVPPLVEDWRLGRQGDWVLADDGGVVEILKWGELPHPHDRIKWKAHMGWCRTVVGSFTQNEKTYMDTDFDLHPNRYRFGSATEEEANYRQRNRKNLSKRERIFVSNLMAGKPLQEAYEDAFGASTNWRERAVFLLKRERIITVLSKNMKEVAEKLGIDYEYVFKGMKEIADKTKSDTVKFNVLKELKDTLASHDKIKRIDSGEMRVFHPVDDKMLAQITAKRVEALDE